ncbi:Heterodimeric efflux ABC transporter, permease/ATP-binding subunit 1 [hydrothermal vent metagenome]|uniref:Heterodimeric efflux ABC transporter, permease/ATP-binding subunit 1 n=1 Tax=hydrothermal vent metagenome TaxID=652676 RepID=A0A3B0T817_9ZZZZ
MADPSDNPTLRAVLATGFRLVGRYISWHPVAFGLAVLGAGMFASAIIGAALFVGSIADTVLRPIIEEGEPAGNRAIVAGLALLGIATWKATGIVVRRTAAGYLQYRTQADVRQRLVDKQLSLTLAWYQQRSVGDLLAVSDADAQGATFVLAPLPYGAAAAALLLGTMVMVFFVDLTLGIIVLFSLVVVLAVNLWGSWQMFQAYERIQARRGDVSDTAHESFDGALTVKALGREDYETSRLEAKSQALRDELVTVGVLRGNLRAIVDTLPPLTSVVVLVVGAFRYDAGAVSPGDLVAITYLLSQLMFPIRLVGFVLWEIAASVAAWRRVGGVLDSDEVQQHGVLEGTSDRSGADLSTDAVAFSYEPGQEILSDIDLTIEPGTTIAIVGPTGSGKSTLVMLLARLWDPISGVITLDARDLRDFAPSELPTEVSFVGQEAFLFDDSVSGNIGLGIISEGAVIKEAADLAAATEFIDLLPNGFATKVGERGASLSGGQRQRIALARALARRPRLLILDDATSAVDPSVESRIQAALSSSNMPATVVLVAYRPSSIRLADSIVYVADGRIVAHATHDELMRTQPGYSRLMLAYERDAEGRAGNVSGAPL